MRRQMSAESMTSLNSMSSACSVTSQQSAATEGGDKNGAHRKKKGSSWLRSSFTKAFSRGSTSSKKGRQMSEDGDATSLRSETSAIAPLSMPNTPVRSMSSAAQLSPREEESSALHELQQRLNEKEMKLTDTQLEALSSAAQLEQLKEAMNKMKVEMSSLKADNSRLQRIVAEKGFTPGASTATSPASSEAPENRLSLGDPTRYGVGINH